MLEVVFVSYHGDRSTEEFLALETYLKRVWFSNGIYHHYGCEKFSPGFTEAFLRKVVDEVGYKEPVDDLMEVMFRPEVLPKRVNKSYGDDLILTSACNFYEGVSQQEVEAFYRKMKEQAGDQAPSFGLNSTLRKRDGVLEEDTWCASGKYGPAIQRIVYWLKKALTVAETPQQEKVIALLIKYYQTGDLRVFDKYSIEWVSSQDEQVDFINGFIEVYGDPLGLKGTWESIVEYKDMEATKRTQLISSNAQWFEDHSPVDSRFRKPVVKGVTAHVICAAMLGGEEYPSTAIGINLPNADWIRAEHGSKSVTIGNLTEAYYAASKNSGMMDEFVVDAETKSLIDRYGYICDDLHTDLHECLGHGSGQLLPGVSPDALKAYGNTIEEARADLFGLYYRWCYENGHAMELLKRDGKTYLRVLDYEELRRLIAALLTEVQRIKSEGDLVAARELVEKYGVKVDGALHQEVLKRYEQLHLAPYKGFLNPVLHPVVDKNGEMVDVKVDYTESYEHQMLRYSNDYSALI